MENKEKDKKQLVLRLSSSLWKELVAWAEDDFRSLNGQIEYLLTECVRHRKKSKDQKGDQTGDSSLF
ncbi:MAG: Arc family DNA-binding protein [Bacteroidales bacterium]|nr:Arc family DNA-binding protein [Bacteroidales bacterium]